jgi:hypothetical protein
MLSRSIEGVWHTILPMMKQVAEREFRLAKEPRNFDPCSLTSYDAGTHSPLEAIAAMPGFLVKDPCPWKAKRRARPGAYPERRLMLQSRAFRPWPQRELELSFERNRLFGGTNSLNFRLELVRKSSKEDINFFLSSTQRCRLPRPRPSLKQKNRKLGECVVYACCMK